MQGGARYQNQVTAWLAAKMLAERPAALIVPRGKLSYFAAESGEAVDDVMAGTDQGDFAFVQAKRSISLSTREGRHEAAWIVTDWSNEAELPPSPKRGGIVWHGGLGFAVAEGNCLHCPLGLFEVVCPILHHLCAGR